MYFDDLTQYQYLDNIADRKILNAGWLDENHPFRRKQNPSENFLDKLFDLCLFPVNKTRGYHQCPFCASGLFGLEVTRHNQNIRLGSAEIRVSAPDGIIYAAPDLIYHYVEAHDYLPPEEFIKAVLSN